MINLNRYIKFSLLVYVIWILLISIIIISSLHFIPYNLNFPQYLGCKVELLKYNPIICSLANFDGVHYLAISQLGYAGYEQAFFPLLPLLIKIIGGLLFNNYLFAGLIISHISLIVAIFLLYKLVKLDYGEEKAKWTVLFLIFFPTSFFFGSVYTESLFLLLIVLAFYGARTNKWWLAGIAGMLASATRLVGVFLFPALIIEYYFFLKRIGKNPLTNIKKIILNFRLWTLLLIPLGLIFYMIYLWKTNNDPFMFLHSQVIWKRESFVLLPQVYWRYFKILMTVKPVSLAFLVASLELTSVTLFIFLLIKGTKKIRISYLVFSWLALLTPTLTGTFLSIPRFVITLFPGFIILSLVTSRKLRYIVMAIFILLFVILLSIFSKGYFIA